VGKRARGHLTRESDEPNCIQRMGPTDATDSPTGVRHEPWGPSHAHRRDTTLGAVLGHDWSVPRGETLNHRAVPSHSMSKVTVMVVVFHCWFMPRGVCGRRRCAAVASAVALASHLCYTHHVAARHRTRVKLNRVFFPR